MMEFMNDETKEITDIILRKVGSVDGDIIASPDNLVIYVYGSDKSILMRVERFGSELSIVDKHHVFRFNFGSDTESVSKAWDIILDNLNFKNV